MRAACVVIYHRCRLRCAWTEFRALAHRSVINEAGWFWRLLFLNNNYHLVHHDLPHVPWFALRAVYEASHQQYVERSGGFLVKGYSEWARRYAFASVTDPVHGDLSDMIRVTPPTSAPQARQFRVISRAGAPHDAHLPVAVEREATQQAI
jgi:fatty acid desaturase